MKKVNRTEITQMPIPLVLVDGHHSIREMMRVVLAREEDYEIVGEAGDGMAALRVCRAKRPKIVVLDLGMPGLSGAPLIRLLKDEPGEMRVVIFTGTSDTARVKEALEAEPDGFVFKTDTLQELQMALRSVARGARYLSPWTSRVVGGGERTLLRLLTATEHAVLQMLAVGMQSKEVAEVLGAAPKTVENHRQHIREKLGVHDSISMARFAIRHGLVAV